MQYRARYYDPAVGTFVGEDPLGFEAGDANLYRYVFNSPTNFTDPDGQIAIPLAVGIGAVAVGVGLAIVANNALQNPEGVQSANRAIGDSLGGLGSRFSDLAQTQQQLAQDAGRNIRDSARQYQGLASSVASAFPTTISIPGAFGPNDGERRPQVTPDLTPVAPNPPVDVGNPNDINKPSSRPSVLPDDFCPAPGINGEAKPDFEKPYFEGRRDIYMGPTPSKDSPVGREVIERMKQRGEIRENSQGDLEVQGNDGNWYNIDQADMSHIDPAVEWWNREGYAYGAKSPEVREWMNNPDNYILEPRGPNRSRGGKTRERYRRPEPK